MDLGLNEYLTEQGQPPLALEAFEEGGPVDLGVVATCEILKKIPAALKQAQATADSSFQPKLVWESGAVPTESGKLAKCGEGLCLRAAGSHYRPGNFIKIKRLFPDLNRSFLD